MDLVYKGIQKEIAEDAMKTIETCISSFYDIITSNNYIMKNRSIFVEISLKRWNNEPLYYITLGMKFLDKTNKMHEILARVTGLDFKECIYKFIYLIDTNKVRHYVLGRLYGEPYTPYPMVTERWTMQDIQDNYNK